MAEISVTEYVFHTSHAELLVLDVKFRNTACYLASGRDPTQLETHGMMPATEE